MTDAPARHVPAAPELHPRRTATSLRVAGAVLVAVLLVGVATWQVGPQPEPVDAGLPASPPPLALPSEVPEDAPLARAAAQLAAGDLERAGAAFVDVVARDQDGVPGQVGLILSRWRSTGPVSVERDLRQLVREYPDSALAALHLGLVQLVLGEDRAARETLRGTIELGRDAADPTSLRMAGLADDLLHPEAFRGTLPVLVQPAEVPPAHRRRLAALLQAVSNRDHRRAARIGEQLDRAADPMVRVATISATFDKADPAAVVQRLSALASDPGTPAAARDRARLMRTLADLWGGESRAAGCTRLAASTTSRTHEATRRLASPIHTELCRAGQRGD